MKITSGTIARTIILALALINQLLTVTGHSIIPIEDETITEVIALLFTIGAALAGWWKNNSFTKSALEADLVKKEKRAEEILEAVAASRNTEEGD